MAHEKKISLTINVDKIDKSQIYEGKKGRYITLTVIPTPNSEHNEYMCVQYIKGEQENPILGNGNDLNFDNPSTSNNSQPAAAEATGKDDDLPF